MTVVESQPAEGATGFRRARVPTPLAGMRVIELSSFVASPLGGMTLARLGAEVIRVEPRGGAPDRTRWPIDPHGTSLYWTGLNQGKKSVSIDIGTSEGRRLVTDLVAASGDGGGIVLTNAAPRAGLTPDELRKRRPDLIHVQLSGRRDGRTAVDYTVNAECGFPSLTGPEDLERPVNHVLPAWDIATGLYLAVGLLAAERHRLRTGEGQCLELSLHDVALATAGQLGYLAEAQLCGRPRSRIGNDVYGDFGRDFVSNDQVRFMVVVVTARHWQRLMDVTGLADAARELEKTLGADFTASADRYRYRHVLAGVLSTWFEAHSANELERALSTTSVLWSRYRTFTELVSEGLLDDHPLLDTVVQPGVGSYRAPGSPLVFDSKQIPPAPAPRIGQHTHEVLSDILQLSATRIAELHARGLVSTAKEWTSA